VTNPAAAALGLDEFDFHARYVPGLQALLPIPVTVLALGFNSMPFVASLASLALAVGLPRTLVQVVRSRGLALEPGLWDSWGGKPTTRMLRLSDTSVATADKDRWRAALSSAAGVALPATAADEAADPADADARYEQVVGHARECTRGDDLLRAENQSYNFERNVLAMAPVALLLAAVAVAATVILVAIQVAADGPVAPAACALGANMLVLAGWIMLPSEARARRMAEKYAVRLFTLMTHRTAQPPGSPSASPT
jgi:hypothetical protein